MIDELLLIKSSLCESTVEVVLRNTLHCYEATASDVLGFQPEPVISSQCLKEERSPILRACCVALCCASVHDEETS